MLLHRVFLHDANVRSSRASGGARYLHKPQGSGRFDNPELYDSWYFSRSPEGAIAETFGNLATWSKDMLSNPAGLRRALATFSVPDNLAIFDFDDPNNLVSVAMRPSQVVTRNNSFTQNKAAKLFSETVRGGDPKWAGLGWWSFHRPHWSNVMLWHAQDRPAKIRLESVEPLTLDCASLQDAARSLSRVIL